MTQEEKDQIARSVLEQLKFDAALIEDLTPVKALKDTDLFEIHGARKVTWSRLCSEMRVQATIDKYRHVDRGQWKEGEEYFASDTNPYTGLIEISHVWYFGCKYRCLVTGTTEPPSWDSADWEFEEGYPFLELRWAGSEDSVYEDDPEITLEVSAYLYNQDLTSDTRMKWEWTRESWHGGSRDTVSDNLWNAEHDNTGSNSIDLVMADMNYRFGTKPERLVYTVTATLLDDEGVPAVNSDGVPVTKTMTIEI